MNDNVICRFEVQSLKDVLVRYIHEWEANVLSEGLNISHLPNWICSGAEAHGSLEKISVVVGFDKHEQAFAFLPFIYSKRTLGGIPYKAIEIGAGLPGYHSDWLSGHKGKQLFDYLRTIITRTNCHAMIFTNVPDASSTAILLNDDSINGSVISRAGEVTSIVHLEDNWDKYLARRKGKFRYNLRKKLQKIDNAGEWNIKWYEEAEDVSKFLDIMLDIEANSWKMQAGIAVVDGGYEHKYYMRLLPYLAKSKAMMNAVLCFNGEAIAYGAHYIWNGQMGGMKTTYKASYSKLSPGIILQINVMQYAFKRDLSVFDFLGDRGEHKDEWANDNISHHSYIYMRPSFRAALAKFVSNSLLKINKQ